VGEFMKDQMTKRIVVIGGGPAGISAAQQASDR